VKNSTIFISCCECTIELSTHDAGNVVTTKDQQLAKAIDALL